MKSEGWQAQAESTMETILSRAQDLASGCGDIKQLVDLGKMVGELIISAETLKGGGDGEKEEGDETD